jgi:small subunit ribosomal protein S16
MGKKKQPFYRIVVADSRSARDGQAVEEIGTYSPTERPGRITVKEERVFEWLRRGAEPSDTVNSLFRRVGIMQKWALIKAGKDASSIELKTELVETSKPTRRGKKTAAAGSAATETPAATGADETAAEEKSE